MNLLKRKRIREKFIKSLIKNKKSNIKFNEKIIEKDKNHDRGFKQVINKNNFQEKKMFSFKNKNNSSIKNVKDNNLITQNKKVNLKNKKHNKTQNFRKMKNYDILKPKIDLNEEIRKAQINIESDSEKESKVKLISDPKNIPGFYYDYEKNRYFPLKNSHTQSFNIHSKNLKNIIDQSQIYAENKKDQYKYINNLSGDKITESTFHIYKSTKFSLSNNFNIKNISKIDNRLFTDSFNLKNNNIINFTNELKNNLFLNGIKITKLKDKIVSTFYEFFEYFNEDYSTCIKNLKNSNPFNSINNNYLLTTFFCNDTKKTKSLIELIKHNSEIDLNTYNHKKEKYNYFANLFKNDSSLEYKNEHCNLFMNDSLNLNLIFDITLIDQKKRNFSICKIIDDFIIYICDDEILIFSLCDIMQLNVNLTAFSFKFSEYFNVEKNLGFIKKNIKNIPQAFNWPMISGLKPKLILNQNQKNKNIKNKSYIEKTFVFLYYNLIFSVSIDIELDSFYKLSYNDKLEIIKQSEEEGYLDSLGKTTEINFQNEILSHIHNVELSIEKLVENNLMKKASLKEIKNFKINNSNNREKNYRINKGNFSQNMNFTYFKITDFEFNEKEKKECILLSEINGNILIFSKNFELIKEIKLNEIYNKNTHPIVQIELLKNKDFIIIYSDSKVICLKTCQNLLKNLNKNTNENFDIEELYSPISNHFKINRDLKIIKSYDDAIEYIGFLNEDERFIIMDPKKTLKCEDSIMNNIKEKSFYRENDNFNFKSLIKKDFSINSKNIYGLSLLENIRKSMYIVDSKKYMNEKNNQMDKNINIFIGIN